ncbi:AAA family ATPase [Janibacter indicus]
MPTPAQPPSTGRVVVLAGPSGSGKSRLAARLHRAHGWPVVRLDDFYKDLDAPTCPAARSSAWSTGTTATAGTSRRPSSR